MHILITEINNVRLHVCIISHNNEQVKQTQNEVRDLKSKVSTNNIYNLLMLSNKFKVIVSPHMMSSYSSNVKLRLSQCKFPVDFNVQAVHPTNICLTFDSLHFFHSLDETLEEKIKTYKRKFSKVEDIQLVIRHYCCNKIALSLFFVFLFF